MKAILTKFLGPTNNRGARVKAWDMDGNSVTVSYRYRGGGGEGDHRAAAEALKEKMGWEGDLIAGGVKHGWAFVFIEKGEEDKPITKKDQQALAGLLAQDE